MLMSGVEAGAIVTTVISICTTATLITWMRGRRSPRPPADAGTRLSEDRVTQIEHALEAIAIEVERIAEGQRFTAKLLAERIEREARGGRPGATGDADGMRRTTPV
jgi:hypothetical protein